MPSRLNNETRRYNYPTELVFDEAGQLIRPGKTSYGARGLEPAYYFDELGAIVEVGFLKKVNLYKEKKTATIATQLALIDERLADLTFDGKEFMRRLVNSSQSEKETQTAIAGASTLAGFVASLIGTPAAGAAVAAGLKAIGGAIYLDNSHIDRYKQKINMLEKEANYLLITKSRLTGEYQKLAAAGQIDTTDQNQVYENQSLDDLLKNSQANKELIPGLNNDTLLYLVIGLVLLIILRKRRKKK